MNKIDKYVKKQVNLTKDTNVAFQAINLIVL